MDMVYSQPDKLRSGHFQSKQLKINLKLKEMKYS